MSAWINLTEDDLRNSKASALVDAYGSAALGPGQANPIDDTIAAVSKWIRVKIQASRKYQVSATPDAIPPGLQQLAMRLITWDLQDRIDVAGALPPTERDRINHSNDLRELDLIAKGETPLEVPDDPETTPEVQSGSLIEQAQAGNSGNSREELSRL